MLIADAGSSSAEPVAGSQPFPVFSDSFLETFEFLPSEPFIDFDFPSCEHFLLHFNSNDPETVSPELAWKRLVSLPSSPSIKDYPSFLKQPPVSEPPTKAKGKSADPKTTTTSTLDVSKPLGQRMAALLPPGFVDPVPSTSPTPLGTQHPVAQYFISIFDFLRTSEQAPSSLIYPQDSHGQSLPNPKGKHLVRLFIRGSHIAVVLDDYLPLVNGNFMFENPFHGILAKALIKAFGLEMVCDPFACVSALTGWVVLPGPRSLHLGSEVVGVLVDTFEKESTAGIEPESPADPWQEKDPICEPWVPAEPDVKIQKFPCFGLIGTPNGRVQLVKGMEAAVQTPLKKCRWEPRSGATFIFGPGSTKYLEISDSLGNPFEAVVSCGTAGGWIDERILEYSCDQEYSCEGSPIWRRILRIEPSSLIFAQLFGGRTYRVCSFENSEIQIYVPSEARTFSEISQIDPSALRITCSVPDSSAGHNVFAMKRVARRNFQVFTTGDQTVLSRLRMQLFSKGLLVLSRALDKSHGIFRPQSDAGCLACDPPDEESLLLVIDGIFPQSVSAPAAPTKPGNSKAPKTVTLGPAKEVQLFFSGLVEISDLSLPQSILPVLNFSDSVTPKTSRGFTHAEFLREVITVESDGLIYLRIRVKPSSEKPGNSFWLVLEEQRPPGPDSSATDPAAYGSLNNLKKCLEEISRSYSVPESKDWTVLAIPCTEFKAGSVYILSGCMRLFQPVDWVLEISSAVSVFSGKDRIQEDIEALVVAEWNSRSAAAKAARSETLDLKLLKEGLCKSPKGKPSKADPKKSEKDQSPENQEKLIQEMSESLKSTRNLQLKLFMADRLVAPAHAASLEIL